MTKVKGGYIIAPLHASLKWLNLTHLPHLFPYARHHLGLHSFLQYLHLCMLNVLMGFLSVCLTSFCIIASKLFVLCELLITTIWALWASTLFAQVSKIPLYMLVL